MKIYQQHWGNVCSMINDILTTGTLLSQRLRFMLVERERESPQVRVNEGCFTLDQSCKLVYEHEGCLWNIAMGQVPLHHVEGGPFSYPSNHFFFG